MKTIKFAFILVTISLISACAAPKYTGTSISGDVINDMQPEIVIVENSSVKKGFLATMENWLTKNNYKYKVVTYGAQHDLEKLTLEYEGYWGVDFAIFLQQAKIVAFYKGEQIAEVAYNAPNNLNTNKFSKAEKRIEYMMEVLFGKLSSEEATKAI